MQILFWAMDQLYALVFNDQMLVWRRYIDASALNRFAIDGMGYVQLRFTCEYLRQQAGMVGRDVEDYKNSSRQIVW